MTQQPTPIAATYTSRPSWQVRAILATCAVVCSTATIVVNLGLFEMRARESTRAPSVVQMSGAPAEAVTPSSRPGKI